MPSCVFPARSSGQGGASSIVCWPGTPLAACVSARRGCVVYAVRAPLSDAMLIMELGCRGRDAPIRVGLNAGRKARPSMTERQSGGRRRTENRVGPAAPRPPAAPPKRRPWFACFGTSPGAEGRSQARILNTKLTLIDKAAYTGVSREIIRAKRSAIRRQPSAGLLWLTADSIPVL